MVKSRGFGSHSSASQGGVLHNVNGALDGMAKLGPPEPRHGGLEFLMCCTGRPGEGARSSARLALGGGAT